MTATRKKTATRRKPQRNTLYLPSASREDLDKIALEIGYRRGRRISSSGVVQYLIKKYSSQAIEELINEDDEDDDDFDD